MPPNNPAARSSDQMTRAHQHADQRIARVGDGLRDALAGLELPAPLLEPARLVVVLAVLELVLEPALEALPARRALLALRRRAPRAPASSWSGVGASRARGAARGLPHELGERTQALGGDFLAPLAQALRQQVAPRRARQRRQQFRAALLDAFDADVDRGHRAARGRLPRRAAPRRRPAMRHPAIIRPNNPSQRFTRGPRAVPASRSFRSSYATISTASTKGTPKAPTTS